MIQIPFKYKITHDIPFDGIIKMDEIRIHQNNMTPEMVVWYFVSSNPNKVNHEHIKCLCFLYGAIEKWDKKYPTFMESVSPF